MPFRYLRDPLFLICLTTYFVNRFVLKSIWHAGFFHEHLNDLICIPFCVPIMLWTERRTGLRSDDEIPRASEVMIPLAVWSVVFELYLPRTAYFGRWCTSDFRDIMYYALGAAAAAVFWRWWYAPDRKSAAMSA